MNSIRLTNAQAEALCAKLENELHWPINDRSINYANDEINGFIFRLTPPPHSTEDVNEYNVDSEQLTWIDDTLILMASDNIEDREIAAPRFAVIDRRLTGCEDIDIQEFSTLEECFAAAASRADHLTDHEKKVRELYVAWSAAMTAEDCASQCCDDDEIGKFNLAAHNPVKIFV